LNAADGPGHSPLAFAHAYPVLYGVWISFFNKHSFFPQQTFIGFDNYVFFYAIRNLGGDVARYGLCAVHDRAADRWRRAALLLNEIFGPQHPACHVIFPYVVPTVVAVIIWKWLLNSQFGLINYLIEKAGPSISRSASWARTGSWYH
jgi:ABC-type sugar transport system permease subunit